MDIMEYLKPLAESTLFKLAVILLIADTVFGILRAVKEKRFNSSVGIDGAIRKAGMLISLVLFFCIDLVLELNLIGFLPEQFRRQSA